MKFLINISTDSEMIGYEAIALAFTLASFDHQVQLYFDGGSHHLLTDDTSRLYGMVQSLALYDLPPAWHGFTPEVLATFDAKILAVFGEKTADDTVEAVLNF